MFRQLKINTLAILLVSATAAHADQVVSASINKQMSTASAPATQPTTAPLTVKSSALTAADNDANQLQEIQRKQAIKDAMNKYNAQSGGSADKNSAMGQTTATNIIINEDGYKAATLQFVDGSTLDVEPGTKIGKYVVDGISMTGVTLHEINCRKKCSTKLIKRAYPRKPVTTNMPQNTSYQSTPVVNDPVVTNNGQEQVPPLVNTK